MVRVAVCPGFSVTGVAIPESPKPVPVIEIPLRVSAPVPEDVSVTALVTVVFRATVPNAALVLLSVSAGDPDGSSSMTNVSDPPLRVAVRVTFCAVLTADTVAVKATLSWPRGTFTCAGTVTATLLLASETVRRELTSRLSVMVQTSVPAPVIEMELHENAVGVAPRL